MTSSALKQVCLIEDHQDYRRVLQMAIRNSDHLACDLAFSSIEACLDGVEPSTRVDVILLDLGLQGMHGVAGIPTLLKRFPEAQILVITVYDHKPVVLEALAVGASGYLLKADRLDTINGASPVPDKGPKAWDTLPLGSESFDTEAFLKALWKSGYRGPIGHQFYNVPGDDVDKLTRAIQAWKKMKSGIMVSAAKA